MRASPPSDRVLAAFGARTPLEHQPTGRGTAWRAGDVILKPIDMSPDALRWQEEVLTPLVGRPDLRVAPPLRSLDGELVVDGWTGWPRLAGRREPGRWDEIVDAGARLSAAMARIPRPDLLDARNDPWAEGDRVAWGERPAEPVRHVRFVSTLLELRRPTSEKPGLVHGDLAGNVLFAPGEAPAVIDLSPYWRPPSYATGIVLADALAWGNAETEWARKHLPDADALQSFVRALVFRIVTDHLADPAAPIADAYAPAVGLAVRTTSGTAGS